MIDSRSLGRSLARFARAVAGLGIALLAALPTSAAASVFYRFNVVAETGVAPFTTATALGSGPSINDKGKVALVKPAPAPSVFLWSPPTGLADIATDFSTYDAIAEAVRINGNDDVVVHARRSLQNVYNEIIVFRSGTLNAGSYMVRSLNGTVGGPLNYQALYQYPAMNNSRTLEDRSNFIGNGDKDGVCDAAEVCVPQIAFVGFRSSPLQRVFATVVQNPSQAADLGIQHEYGLNITTSPQPRPMMADDGRIVVRGSAATNPILLFNYDLSGTPTTIAGTDAPAGGFATLGLAPGITPDGKVIAFAGNRGQGDGIFLSIELAGGTRRLVRIVGENATLQKPELGVKGTGAGDKLFFASIELDSRIGIVYTPESDGALNKSVVVSFIGTPNAASRTNPGSGKPFVFSVQKGLWTIRIDLEAPRYKDICLTRAPGSAAALPAPAGNDTQQVIDTIPVIVSGAGGICETGNDHASETLFSRSSPLPVVQIGDTIKSSTGNHTVSAISVHDPIAQAKYTTALTTRTARKGDHRVVFHATFTDTKQMIVAGSHLDSDQDGLLDHWETEGIDLDGTGTIDLNLPAMGANPLQRDLFIQLQWSRDRPDEDEGLRNKHQPAGGVVKTLVDFYAAAPAIPNVTPGEVGIPAGIKLHVDGGEGMDLTMLPRSVNMGAAARYGGELVDAPGDVPIEVLYFRNRKPPAVAGLTAVDYDSLKEANFWTWQRGAREFAFNYVVLADFIDVKYDGAAALTGTATGGTTYRVYVPDVAKFQDRHPAMKITAGTGAGQVRKFVRWARDATGLFYQPERPWVTPPDATSQFVLLEGSGGSSAPGDRYDGAFSTGKSVEITLGGFRRGPDNTQGSFVSQWKTIVHELGHILSLMHGGTDHDNYKAGYQSLMNYAYELCDADHAAKDANGAPLAGAAACPIDDYSKAGDAVSNDYSRIDLKSAVNLNSFGNAFGAPQDSSTSPYKPDPVERDEIAIDTQLGPRDQESPTVHLTTPAGGTAFALGSTIPVSFTATDNISVAKAEVMFDVNGDGTVDTATETFAATPGAGNSYTATIPAVSGPSGTRPVSVLAYDTAGNAGSGFVIVNVGTVAPVAIPNVVAQAQDVARYTLAAAVFTIGTITYQQSLSVAAGQVISQNPAAGASRSPGTVVNLVVSMGATGVVVPKVEGLSQVAATAAITSAGLAVGELTVDESKVTPTSEVITQWPVGGTYAAGGTPVDLLVMSAGSGSAPTVATGAAGSITATGATLNGTVSSNGASTTVTFQYGSTTTYGNTATAAQSPLAPGASGAAVSAAITGLTCNTLYHFKVVGANGKGTTNGSDLTFTTAVCPATSPTVTTSAATSVTTTGATLNGTVSSNGASTTVTFQYGLTTSYGSTATAAQSPLAPGASGAAVSAAITGLACNTLHHFRVVGVNSAGTTNGTDMTVTTVPCGGDDGFPPGGAIPPGWTTVSGADAGWIVATDSTNQGPYSLKSADIGDSQWAGIQVSGTFLAGNISFAVRVSSEYYDASEYYGDFFEFYIDNTLSYWAKGELPWTPLPPFAVPAGAHTFTWVYIKDIDTSEGADATWIDTVVLPPTAGGAEPIATTSAASAVGTGGATLNGTVSSNGSSATVTFQYGLTTSYGGSAAAAQSPLPADASNAAVSAAIVGLTCKTPYHFRVVAANGVATVTGADMTFTTGPCHLDVDANITATKYDALTDGLLILRYLRGLTGTSLTTGALGSTATRTDPTAVKAYLDSIRPALDIDGNGTADAPTDGLLILRYMFGLRGGALIAGAIDPLATRKTASDIEAYLQTLMP